MAPQSRAEILVLKISFQSTLDPHCPRFSLAENKYYPSRAILEVRNWFDDTISREKSKVLPNRRVRFCEWGIKSDNPNLFETDGYFYDHIIVILGEDGADWMFHSDTPAQKPVWGQGCLSISYCGCCLNNHYIKIIEAIKVCMAKQRSRN